MVTKEEIRKRRDEINRLASRHGAHDVRIFGSVARGDATDADGMQSRFREVVEREALLL